MPLLFSARLNIVFKKIIYLQLAFELSHKQENRDHILGLKTRTHAGRPNWDKVHNLCMTFSQLVLNYLTNI